MKFTLKKYLPEIVYGGNDGIVTTFAIVSGFIGASAENPALGSGVVVLIFGLANLFGDATSMGLGNFLSERSRNEQILKEENLLQKQIIEESSDISQATKKSLESRGLNSKESAALMKIFKREKKLWLDYMRSIEFKLKDVSDENPVLNALTTFFSFIIFGTIPLLPFFFFEPNLNTSLYSVGGTFIALVLLGLLRWRLVGRNLIKNVLEILLIGGAASLIAFFIGYLFRGA